MATAADVGPRYDVVIDGNGFVFADSEEMKAVYGLTPTFVQRSNVEGDYGDVQQDFWLTWTQNDWSLGEQQKYSSQPEENDRKFWDGAGLDLRVPGEITLYQYRRSITAAAVPCATAGVASLDVVYFATSTNLYYVDFAGTITTTPGVHGLGAAPSRWGLATDPVNDVFLSTTTAGTVGVRRWNGSAFETWSATGADSLAFLNNALYGYSNAAGTLIRYATSGVATTLFTWQGADGGASNFTSKLVAFGGDLLILRYREGAPKGAELWLYDGVAPAKIAEFPSNFVAYDCAVLGGTVFVSGSFRRYTSTTLFERPAVFYYSNGSQDVLWQASDYTSTASVPNQYPALGLYDNGLVWYSAGTGSIRHYNPTTGAVTAIAPTTAAYRFPVIGSASSFFLAMATDTTVTVTVYPHNTEKNSGGQVTHSLVDFDSSLAKYFKGVKIDAEIPTGAAIDIYRQLDSHAASAVLVQAGAVSGTEYALDVAGRNISINLLFTRGTDTNTAPKLKRVAVRAIPLQPSFKKRTYVLNLTGRDNHQNVRLRDGTFHNKDGLEMATSLQTSENSSRGTAPISISDVFGTYTGIIENVELRAIRPEEFIAVVQCRSV